MDRIIQDLANSPAHINYSRFLDLIVDHERNPNAQSMHSHWLGSAVSAAGNPNVGYELAGPPKPGTSSAYGATPTSSAAAEYLQAARSLALHDAPSRSTDGAPFKYFTNFRNPTII